MLKIPVEYGRDTSQAKFKAISRQISLALLPDISTDFCRRDLVYEPGMIRSQKGTRCRSEIVAVLGTSCAVNNSISCYVPRLIASLISKFYFYLANLILDSRL
jgi:hypothetical protein